MKHSKRARQKGYALISAMAVGVIALSVTGALMLRLTNASKQVTQREQRDEIVNVSEAVITQVMDSMAEITSQKVISGTSKWGVELTASELAERILTRSDFISSGSDFMNTDPNAASEVKFIRGTNYNSSNPSQGDYYYKSNNVFFDSVQNDPDHSSEFWKVFKNGTTGASFKSLEDSAGHKVGSTSYNNDFSFAELQKDAFATYKIKKGGRVEAEAVLSLIPLGTDIEGVKDAALHNKSSFVKHYDVYKLHLDTYVPSKQNVRYKRSVDVVINRDASMRSNTSPFPEAAILTDGSANLGNVDTTAGTCAGVSCIDRAEVGDVHVNNGDLMISANGSVQGKATATGKVTVKTTDLPYSDYAGATGDPRDTTEVTDRIIGASGSKDNAHNSRSGADKIEIPEFDSGTSAVDSTPCTDLDPSASVVLYRDCKLDSTYTKNNNNDPKLELQGTVHIAGDFNNKGSVRCGGPSPCRVVIDGKADTGGNGSSNYYSGAETLYIVRGMDTATTPFMPYATKTDCLDIGGTPDASGANGTLFYVENPNCNTKFHGNFEFFGALFSHGTFEGKGNASAAGIQRDTNMDGLKPFLVLNTKPKDQLYPKVVSWKAE